MNNVFLSNVKVRIIGTLYKALCCVQLRAELNSCTPLTTKWRLHTTQSTGYVQEIWLCIRDALGLFGVVYGALVVAGYLSPQPCCLCQEIQTWPKLDATKPYWKCGLLSLYQCLLQTPSFFFFFWPLQTQCWSSLSGRRHKILIVGMQTRVCSILKDIFK